MNYKDIAIIGMSMRLPQANNPEELHENLCAKKDCIRTVPENRRELLKLDPDKKYLEVGYIDDIEYFDHSFFNIASMEADVMCVEQRMSLEMAVEAILDAGYSLEDFRGKNCCVYYSSSENEYKLLAGQDSAAAYTGNLKSLTAGKICYYLDLRGPNVTVDSACSSSLVGMHEACMKIVSGECDYALIGGLSVNIYIPCFDDNDFNNLGVISGGGRSYSFDARAQGTGMGEGGGFVLLKSLEGAQRDHDHIYGIVRGSAVNCDGARGSSLTAPSATGQQDAILTAWKRGNINGTDLTEFEAHGTGTLIGDPIEAEGIENSLKQFADNGEKVWLSALKSSIGHLAASAGIAAVLKCAVQFEKGVTYPISNFEKPNPYIDFSNMRLQPLQEVRHWKQDQRRIVGINSFGFSGTNAHVVMENARETHCNNGTDTPLLLKISARHEESLQAMARQTEKFLQSHPENAGNILYTMNTGRDDYAYRICVTGESVSQLVEALSKAEPAKTETRKTALILMQPADLTADLLAQQIAELRLMKKAGFSYEFLLADAYGKFILAEAETEAKALASPADLKAKAEEFTASWQDKTASACQKLELIRKTEPVTAVFFNSVSASASGMPQEQDNCRIITRGADGILGLLATYYTAGGSLDWKALYPASQYYKTSAPTYRFRKIKHWIYPKHQFSMLGIVDHLEEHTGTETETIRDRDSFHAELLALWSDVLEQELSGEDDFFDCGGNSLTGMMMIEEVQKRWGISVSFDDVYDYATVDEFCDYLLTKVPDAGDADITDQTEQDKQAVIPELPADAPFSLNYSQRIIQQTVERYPNNSGWNLCMSIGMEGVINLPRLESALCKLINANDSLRTVFFRENGTVMQRVLPPYQYQLPVIKAEGSTDEERLNWSRAQIHKAANHSVPILAVDDNPVPPVDFRLYRVRADYSILYLAVSHVISDGTSLGLMLAQINRYYLGNEPAEQSHDFRKYCLCQASSCNTPSALKQRTFWEQYLKGLDFTPQYHPVEKTETALLDAVGKNLVFSFSPALYQSMNTVCRSMKVTPYIYTLYAFQVLIARLTQRRDLHSLTVMANRRDAGYQSVLGCFVQLLIVRSAIRENEPIREQMHHLYGDIRNIQENQEYPIYPLLHEMYGTEPKCMGDWGEFFMAFQNYKSENLSLEDLKLSLEPIAKNGCMTKLQLAVSENSNGMYGIFQYNESFLTAELVEQIKDLYLQILETMAQNPDMTASELLSLL